MAKNTHLEHLEDDIFNQGYAGATNALNFLQSLRDMLSSGKGGNNTKVTVKWDGAPAIICGTDPETGLFFVGNKSVFNKTTPKICYSHADIDHWYSGSLNPIMKQCLDQLKKVPIKGVVQGDLLYTKRPDVIAMRGQPCYRFKPNTITYVIPKYSELGKKVASSKLGIVFHTTYSGDTIGEMSAGFGVNVSGMQGVKDVAVFSSTFENVNGMANLTPGEVNNLNRSIAAADRSLKMGRKFLDDIQKTEGPQSFSPPALFKVYFNQVIRGGNTVPDANGIAAGYGAFVIKKYDEEIKKKKTEKAQKEWNDRKTKALSYLNSNKSVMIHALSGFKGLISAKEQVINKLNKIEGVGTFLEDENGYRVTSPEGFVAIKDGTAIKLVDRLEFSRANFTVAKDWGK